MIGRFFHLPKNKQFHIPYRFHDPDKEEMEAREERIKMELGIKSDKKDENYRPNIKGQFRNALGRASRSDADARRSYNTRLISLIVILALVFFLIFYL